MSCKQERSENKKGIAGLKRTTDLIAFVLYLKPCANVYIAALWFCFEANIASKLYKLFVGIV